MTAQTAPQYPFQLYQEDYMKDQDYILRMVAELERSKDVNGLAELLRAIIPILSDDEIEMVLGDD